MKLKNKLLLLFLLHCCVFYHPKVVESDEISILLSIKAGLIDPLDYLKDWQLAADHNTTSVHCGWSGVQCSSSGAVEKLHLPHMNLSGIVRDEIQGLQALTSLDLSCKAFASPLPKSLSNLTALQRVDLSQNYFIDRFPAGLGTAAGLVALNASGNNFSGHLMKFSRKTSVRSSSVNQTTISSTSDILINLKFQDHVLLQLKFLCLIESKPSRGN